MALAQRVKECSPIDTRDTSNWGAKLFLGTLLAVLAFFWWLVIYSGGVVGHHG